MRIRLAVPALVFIGLVGITSPAAADPISVWYQVTVTERALNLSSNYSAIDPYSFVMSVTFDDTLTGHYSGSDGDARSFQKEIPTFSGVPSSPDVPQDDFTGSNVILSSGTGYSYAKISRYTIFDDNQTWRRSGIELSRDMYSRADYTNVDSLVQFLRNATFDQWYLLHDADTGWSPDTVQLRGTATQIPAPVPEPATMALVAIGLAGAAWRARRMQSRG